MTPRKRRLTVHLSPASPKLVASHINAHLAGVLNREERVEILWGGGGKRAYVSAAAFS